jgi:outer membrane protein assembly factor BamD
MLFLSPMKALVAVSLLLVLAACSSYNQTLKSDDYDQKFAMANTLYDKGQYARSVALYEQVYQRMPKANEGEVAYYRLGKAYYEEEDWYMASYYLSAFPQRFPFSPKCEECHFLSALCAVQNSPEPSLDQNETEMALNELQLFISKYPQSERIDTCNQVMDQLRFKLETKDVLNIRLYAKTENYRAATVSAESFLESYPVSTYREEVSAILLRNSYLLTLNSVETKLEERIAKTRERYNNFLAEFPESPYLREFDDYLGKLNAIPLPSATKPN